MRVYIAVDNVDQPLPLTVEDGCTLEAVFNRKECLEFIGTPRAKFPGTLETLNGVPLGVPARMSSVKLAEFDKIGFRSSASVEEHPEAPYAKGNVDICLKDSNIYCQLPLTRRVTVRDAVHSDLSRATFRMTDEALDSCKIRLNNVEVSGSALLDYLNANDEIVIYPGLRREGIEA